MSENYLQGNRVIAFQGKFQGKSGEVIRSEYSNPFQHGYIVKLDEEGIEEYILEMDLQTENLKPDDIDVEITELQKLINQEADKISGKVKKELTEHLSHLQNALKSQDKLESDSEYTYISKEMKRVFQDKSIKENVSLKKIKHYWEKSLK
ncbi:hypothetical protein NIES2111_00440 [Nostoc sp. NIES-2111]|nr:hypothetical protein NIES2111_00440 [Nostoc sp. NIES-2111]